MKKIIALLFVAIFALASCKVYHYQENGLVVYDPTITDEADQPNQWLKTYSLDALAKLVVNPEATGARVALVATYPAVYAVGAKAVMDSIQLGGYATGLGGAADERYLLPMDNTTGLFGVKKIGAKTVYTFFVPTTVVATDGWAGAGEIRLEFAQEKATDWNGLKRIDWEKLYPGLKDNPYIYKENSDYFQVRLVMGNAANGFKPPFDAN